MPLKENKKSLMSVPFNGQQSSTGMASPFARILQNEEWPLSLGSYL